MAPREGGDIRNLLACSDRGSGFCFALLCAMAVALSLAASPWLFAARRVFPAQNAAAAHAISGSMSPASDASGATVSLSGPMSASATVDSSGKYVLRGLVNGRYAVTPSKEGYSFNPSTEVVTISDSDVADIDFSVTSVKPTYSISGVISPATCAATTVTLTGAASVMTTADSSGKYSFSGLPDGSYTVTPSKPRATFDPTRRELVIHQTNATDVNFTCSIRGSE